MEPRLHRFKGYRPVQKRERFRNDGFTANEDWMLAGFVHCHPMLSGGLIPIPDGPQSGLSKEAICVPVAVDIGLFQNSYRWPWE